MKSGFKTSMFGFNKEDVVNFIDKQNREYEKKLQELQAENTRLQGLLETQKEEFSQDQVAYKVLKESLSSDRERAQKIKDLAILLQDDFESVLASAKNFESDMECIRLEATELSKKLKVAESYREKAEKFDRLAEVLSSMMMGEREDVVSDSIDLEVELSEVFQSNAPEKQIENVNALKERLQAVLDELNGLQFAL